MPLHILLILVIGGIAGIALALHLLGLTGAPALSRDTARQAWARAYPDDPARAVMVTQDGRVARIETQDSRGLVWQMGADTCARMLTGTEEAHARGERVTLRLNDYAAPGIRLRLTPQEQSDWADWMATI